MEEKKAVLILSVSSADTSEILTGIKGTIQPSIDPSSLTASNKKNITTNVSMLYVYEMRTLEEPPPPICQEHHCQKEVKPGEKKCRACKKIDRAYLFSDFKNKTPRKKKHGRKTK